MSPDHPIRVLLVDDQELFRAGIAVIIDAQPDLEVIGQAADGWEAIRLNDDLLPDVILMDLRMPELDGVSATREIFAPARVAGRPRPPKVIVLTTFDLDDRAAGAIRYGASGFLLKDSTPEMLCQAIRTVHAGNAVFSPQELTTLMSGELGRSVESLPPEYEQLTEREREVMAAVAKGLSNAEICDQLFAAESTVKAHIGAILRKLSLRDRVQIVVFAYEHGLDR